MPPNFGDFLQLKWFSEVILYIALSKLYSDRRLLFLRVQRFEWYIHVGHGGSEHIPGSPRRELRSAAEVISQTARAHCVILYGYISRQIWRGAKLRPRYRGLAPKKGQVWPKKDQVRAIFRLPRAALRPSGGAPWAVLDTGNTEQVARAHNIMLLITNWCQVTSVDTASARASRVCRVMSVCVHVCVCVCEPVPSALRPL
jgi:hypothetical protein